MSRLQLTRREPISKQIYKCLNISDAIILYFDTDPHQGLGEFVEAFATTRRPLDKPRLGELAELLGSGLRLHEGYPGDVFHGRGLPLLAQVIDELALERRHQVPHPLLIIRGEVVDHVHERRDELVERLLREELR